MFATTPLGIFQQSLALQERDWLGTMAVDFYCDLRRFPFSLIPRGRARSYLAKRMLPELDARRVRTHPLPSIVRRLGARFPRSSEGQHAWIWWLNGRFDAWVASQLGAFGNLVVGYEGSSLLTFRRAKALGLPTILYQPIMCAEVATSLLAEEAKRFPQLTDTLRYNWFPPKELARRCEERELADLILCASSATKRSLIEVGVPAEKIHVEPYGVDQKVFAPSTDKLDQFSIIWASAFTQTKGIAYLLEALARNPVPGAELVLAGYPAFGADPVLRYEDRIRVRRLGTVDRPELSQVMRRCHVHVFPTIVEGFGRNIIEAMASGLPVVTTPNGAGPDLIEDGVTGFIVPIRDVDAIADRLAWIAGHPEEAVAMGQRARDRVAPLTPADYRTRFADQIGSVWSTHREAT